MRSHWLGPHPCIGQSAARRPSSPLRINVLAHARAVSRKPHRHPSRCQILSAGSFARLGSLTRNSLRFSWSLSEMRPLRLLRASECVARRAAPGSCSALRAQPRRGLDRAEQSIREHGTHNFLWAEECNFMPQPFAPDQDFSKSDSKFACARSAEKFPRNLPTHKEICLQLLGFCTYHILGWAAGSDRKKIGT